MSNKNVVAQKKKVAVLISGNGGNLQALIDACKTPDYPAEIVGVISNKAEAYGLVRAQNANIKTATINHKNFTSREEFDAELHKQITAFGAEIVCLAGFMRLLSESFVNKWQGKMLNIHPSLLPNFKGAHAIKDALAAGAKTTGCSVHFVIPEMDAGKIILQREIAIDSADTEESLAIKIHAQEHIAYPEALCLVASGEIVD